LAGFSNSTMIFMDNLKISELVTAAYLDLGDGGIICSAVGHSCDECCHAFKDVADVIPNQDDDPAALADVCMIVIDGIVMGPRHCAIAGCEAGLLNAQTGVFCQEHEEEMEDCCHMKGCNKNKVGCTQAC
ncbi:hypothetical protein BDN71DRAFT_1351812, partial [Pleurotus eryngii]